MPRLNIKIVAIAAAVAVVAAAFLYVILARDVHAKPPQALANLAFSATPKPMADVAFSDAAGARHTLSSYKGRYVLLNLWATWCAPCVKELPALSRLQAALPTNRFTVVTVNVGRGSAADTVAFLKAHGVDNLPAFLDSNAALLNAMGEVGLPVSVLIDPQGHEIARAADPADWDNANAIAYFKKLTAS